ncbi:hypothetical protein DE146DRAFT_640694 [Phaeosphaeria sp. MPI-PUGE-AT-0046c]|nr:hypothetical protein DE146DRAFT_640694 [Phaeosphaeria sp. MPI-PUGE-AT-0046c]
MAPAWLEKFIVREDATPDPRRSSDRPTLEIQYTAVGDHRRVASVENDVTPRYEVERKAILGAWGSKCYITTPRNEGKEVAVIDFHGLPHPFIEIQFPQRHHQIDISLSKRKFEASGGLGQLHWKPTGMKAYGHASWELRDKTSMVMVVQIDDKQVNAVISLWRNDLDSELVEELVVVGIAQIEEYKRMLRNSKMSLVGVGASAGPSGALATTP